MKEIKLNNGITMPILGFGVFQISDLNIAENVVEDTIRSGLSFN